MSFFRKRKNILKRKKETEDIDPDEIFLDSSNLPKFNIDQFEGRIEKPISKNTVGFLMIFFILVVLVFSGRVWYLQIAKGDELENRSENNRLHHELIFPERGIVFDRNSEELAWNEKNLENPDFSLRKFTEAGGFGHLLGFVDYPSKDSDGFYYESNIEGKSGLEKYFQERLGGTRGLAITEIDAVGKVVSENLTEPPQDGRDITLSIDKETQSELYNLIRTRAESSNFVGGAGIIMNIHTGEILAMTSYPEFNSNILTGGADEETINTYNENPRAPFLNRATAGLYAPGSIIKPFIAVAALEENVITPDKQILSTGSISIPNPYFPDKFSVFNDWKAHGWVDMRTAIAVSSDVYFYEIGGGFKDQEGLGIERIEKYLREFGLAELIGLSFAPEEIGVIPNPTWKNLNFEDGVWRLGDTYNTSIGQYGFQTTVMQIVRAVASIANNGLILRPSIEKVDAPQVERHLPFEREHFEVVREGMREGAINGTASALNVPYVKVAAKTGTAEIGISKSLVNSWVMGFWPSDEPEFAFTILMEKGPANNLVGAASVARNLLDWLNRNKPDYLK